MYSKIIAFCLVLATISLFTCSEETPPAPAANGDAAETEQAATPSDPRFELLPSSQTGIAFSNKITESYQQNILTNAYLYNGGGVAVLDVNNDGLPDLYFTATQQSNKLYLNKGNWQFEDITEKAGVGATEGLKTGVTVVDVNGDGFQDLYVCRSGKQPGALRANLLFINNGDLTFAEKAAEYGLADQSSSNQTNFFDYDLDGDLDAYVLNHPVDFGSVNNISAKNVDGKIVRKTEPLTEFDSDRLYRNNGDGTFTDVSKKAGINNRAWGLSVTVTDFNNDRYPDVFVGNDYIEPDYLYINNGDGTFSIQTDQYFRHMSNHTMGVDIADLNNDGLVDLVGLDMVAEDFQRQKQLMTTMMSTRYNKLVTYGYGHQIMRNVLQLNTGRPASQGDVFSEIGVLSGVWNTDWSWAPLLADFDNDGYKDLYVTNGYRRDLSDLDYLMYTAPENAPGGKLDPKKFPSIYDYLNLIPSTPLRNYMFKNVDGVHFKNVNREWGMVKPTFSSGTAYVDLDNDGDLDLLVSNIDADILVYKNMTADKGGTNWLQVICEGTKKNPRGIGARVKITFSDGSVQYQEMAATRGFLSSSQQMLHFGFAPGNKVEKLQVQWPPNGRVQTLKNIEPNQRITLKYTDAKKGKWEETKPAPLFKTANNTGLDFRHVEDAFEDFDRERLLPHKFSDLGPSIAVGDVNGDGLEDVYVGGARDQAGLLFLQNKNSKFVKTKSQAWETEAYYEDMGAAFFDADGDNDLDLYIASGGSTYDNNSANYQDRLYINDGKGNFSKSKNKLPAITASGSNVTPYDFDGDGDMDLIIGGLVTPGAYPTPPATCFLKNENGKFSEICADAAPGLKNIGMVNDMVWADIDGDKKDELIVAGEWLPISVFKNENGKLSNATASFGLGNTNGWWNSVHVADLDGDGDMDIVAGNLGENTRLKASADKPLKLFAKDFDNSGNLDAVLAYYKGDKLYPLPNKDLMIQQMPVLKKKFVFYKDYVAATMQDVFSEKDLKDAQQYSANTFATSWFENKNGKFVQHELPVQAQFSPTNAIDVADYNGDGNMDILLVGNSYAPDVETGRYDAGNGVLLFGNGKGGYEFAPNTETGFWATKEARDLAKVKLANGKTLFLVANNNDVLQAYVLE